MSSPLLISLVGLSLLASTAAHAQIGRAQTVLDVNSTFDAALAGKDRAALDALLDPDFTWILPDDSFYGRADTLAAMPESAPSKTGEAVTVEERPCRTCLLATTPVKVCPTCP